jgi:hypothetical protein
LRIRLIAKGVKMSFTFKYKVPFMVAGMSLLTYSTNVSGHSAPSISSDEMSKVVETNDSVKMFDMKQTSVDVIEFNSTIPTHASSQRYDVVYHLANGDEIVRRGGTRAWRNNNPGCIRPGSIADAHGAIGSAGGFAVFPDEQSGMAAIAGLLLSDKYRNKTIGAALYSYAPPFENDTIGYQNYVRKLTGLSTNMRISDLTPEQLHKLVMAIRKIEGWNIGTEISVVRDTIANKVMSQTQHTI